MLIFLCLPSNMISSSNLLDRSHRRRSVVNWRQANVTGPLLPSNLQDIKYAHTVDQSAVQTYRRKLFASSKFKLALVITFTIVTVQLFIVNHYLGRGPILSLRSASLSKEDLFNRYHWFCQSFSHLNRIKELANQHQVELVIVDPDLLSVVGALKDNAGEAKAQVEFAAANYKSHQGPSEQKTVIHLAAINDTSGGQPNLKSFYEALKNSSYVMLKYDDASQTMPHEVYRRAAHQFDDVQADAIRDLNQPELGAGEAAPIDFEISKIYTEFMSHLFILNSSKPELATANCWRPNRSASHLFIVVHLFVLYNYEYEPDKMWIQSNLRLGEIERHKLLAYGVHNVDLKIPLEHYYIHRKREAVPLLEISTRFAKIQDHFKEYRVFKSSDERLLEFANNTYSHCKHAAFNMSYMMDGNRRMSNYLRLLDSAQPLRPSSFRTSFDNQMHTAFQFMKVLSESYGNFSYWLTGSSLLAYHKFCELVTMPSGEQMYKYGKLDVEVESDSPTNVIVNLELGLFADELNVSMLEDLSNANLIGVTMTSDWSKPNSHISFQVADCPNLIFNLYPYELQRDFYRHYFITKTNLTFNHKFRRGPLASSKGKTHSASPIGRHVFATNNLKLCWTRIDRFHPFKVPCDAYDHLRRIFII